MQHFQLDYENGDMFRVIIRSNGKVDIRFPSMEVLKNGQRETREFVDNLKNFSGVYPKVMSVIKDMDSEYFSVIQNC